MAVQPEVIADQTRSSSVAARASSPDAPVISVVTPFYNSADSLERCIESVLAQSYGNFEYILADNCCNDGSTEIAGEYARRDPRIRYIRFDQLLPQVPNYNRALRQISEASLYCKIVQADDYLYPDCLATMLNLARQYPSAGLISSTRAIGADVDPTNFEDLPEFMTGSAIGRATIEGKVFAFGSPTTVMYRADLVRAKPEFYRKEEFFDDVGAAFDVLTKSDFVFSREKLSYTSRDPNSTFGRVLSYDISPLVRLIGIQTVGASFYSQCELRPARKEIETTYYEHLLRALAHRPDRWRYLSFHRSTLWDSCRSRISILRLAMLAMHKLALRASGKTEPRLQA
jgi:glycosyltransferase involved in cell wall biosynthesis